jgi:hypothetical protein
MGDKFDFMNEILNDEFPENQNTKFKTEEELEKLSSDVNLSELEKGVHLLMKGYELQKKSIIQNLHRYLVEEGANTKLVPII